MTDQPNAYRQLEESREDLSVRQRRRRVSGGGIALYGFSTPACTVRASDHRASDHWVRDHWVRDLAFC